MNDFRWVKIADTCDIEHALGFLRNNSKWAIAQSEQTFYFCLL